MQSLTSNTSTRSAQLLQLALGIVVVAGVALLMFQTVAARGLAFDFIDHYHGAQAAFVGESPYSEAVTERNQIAWYGSVSDTNDPQRFNYPAYSIFVFGIFAVLPPETAIVAWATVQLMLCLIMLHVVGRGVLPAVLMMLLLREPVVSLLLAQATLWSAAWVGFGMVALQRGYSVRAGLCFAVATLHPVLTVSLALLVLLRDRKALLTFVLAMSAAFLLSTLWLGWWVQAWIDNLLNYSSGVSYMVWVAQTAPLLIPVGLVLLIAALRQREVWSRFALSLSSLVLLLPLTGLYHLVLFLPAVARLGWRWWIAVGLVSWGISLLPFELRWLQVVALVALVVGYEYRAAFPFRHASKQLAATD